MFLISQYPKLFNYFFCLLLMGIPQVICSRHMLTHTSLTYKLFVGNIEITKLLLLFGAWRGGAREIARIWQHSQAAHIFNCSTTHIWACLRVCVRVHFKACKEQAKNVN